MITVAIGNEKEAEEEVEKETEEDHTCEQQNKSQKREKRV